MSRKAFGTLERLGDLQMAADNSLLISGTTSSYLRTPSAPGYPTAAQEKKYKHRTHLLACSLQARALYRNPATTGAEL